MVAYIYVYIDINTTNDTYIYIYIYTPHLFSHTTSIRTYIYINTYIRIRNINTKGATSFSIETRI